MALYEKIPDVRDTVVKNKKILYRNWIFPIDEDKKNLVITEIDGIKKEYLNDCIKLILESNPNVVFNTIQYSINNNKLYFYTNTEISTERFKEFQDTIRNDSSYDYCHNGITVKRIPSIPKEKNKLFNDIIKLLSNDSEELIRNKEFDKDTLFPCYIDNHYNNSFISLYDISNLLDKEKDIYNKEKESFNQYLTSEFHNEYGYSNNIGFTFSFNNNEGCLNIYISPDSHKTSYNIAHFIFSKKDDKLYIKDIIRKTYGLDHRKKGLFYSHSIKDNISNNDINYANNLLSLFEKEFSDFYDLCMYYKINNIESINSVNSDFTIDIKNFEVFTREKNKNEISSDLLQATPSYEDYMLFCDELFKRIYVRIADCPAYIQKDLYEARKKQIEERKKANIQENNAPIMKLLKD